MSFLSYIANPVQQSAEQMRKMIQVSAVMPAPGVGETGEYCINPHPGQCSSTGQVITRPSWLEPVTGRN